MTKEEYKQLKDTQDLIRKLYQQSDKRNKPLYNKAVLSIGELLFIEG